MVRIENSVDCFIILVPSFLWAHLAQGFKASDYPHCQVEVVIVSYYSQARNFETPISVFQYWHYQVEVNEWFPTGLYYPLQIIPTPLNRVEVLSSKPNRFDLKAMLRVSLTSPANRLRAAKSIRASLVVAVR